MDLSTFELVSRFIFALIFICIGIIGFGVMVDNLWIRSYSATVSWIMGYLILLLVSAISLRYADGFILYFVLSFCVVFGIVLWSKR